MVALYEEPLRDEPVAVELHNTLFAVAGQPVDGLADPGAARAWLAGIDGRLPSGGAGGGPRPDDLVALREVVREALRAVADGTSPSRSSIEAINRHSTRAPQTTVARWRRGGPPVSEIDFGRASRADVVLSALAADAIDLLTGPRALGLRACGAPGCVLIFLKDHPRREWCSSACGNRARQARHYRRTHPLCGR